MRHRQTRAIDQGDDRAAVRGFSDYALRIATYGVLAVFFLLALIAIFGAFVLH